MTLIEKIVVAFIIGILGAIALPSWMGFVSAQQLKTDADQSMQFLRSTQSEAKKQAGHTQSVLKSCPTVDSCWAAQLQDLNQLMCNNLVAALIERPSLLSAYKAQANYVVWEDGSCTLPTTTLANPTALAPYAYPAQTPNIVRESYSQLSLVRFGANDAGTVPGTVEPTGRETSRRDKAATKKPPKNNLKLEGCFRLNGQFLMKTTAGWSEVSWQSIPANTTIQTKAPLCPFVNVN